MGPSVHYAVAAESLLALALTYPKLVSKPKLFICHSMGGIVVKELAELADSQSHGSATADEFLKGIKGAVFMGTPHGGATSPAWLIHISKMFRGAATFGLNSSDELLFKLNTSYRRLSEKHSLKHLVLIESLPQIFKKRIVEAYSSDPGLPDTNTIRIGVNHTDICKPVSKEDLIYRVVLEFVEKIKKISFSNGVTKNIPSETIELLLDSTSGIKKEKFKVHKINGLPQAERGFRGRQTILEKMSEDLFVHKQSISLIGPSGIGKTQIAIEFASRWGDHLYNTAENIDRPLVFISCSVNEDMNTAMEKALIPFGGSSTSSTKDELLRTINSYRPFFIIDSAENFIDLKLFLSLLSSLSFIVISQDPDQASGTTINVPPLEDHEALQTLEYWKGSIDEKKDCEALCEQLGNFPLALKIAGKFLQRTKIRPKKFLSQISTNATSALAQAGDSPSDDVIRKAIERSIKSLSKEGKRVIQFMSNFPLVPIHLIYLKKILDIDGKRFFNEVQKLVDTGVIVFVQKDLVAFAHNLIHTYSVDILTRQKEPFSKIAELARGHVLASQNDPLEQQSLVNLRQFYIALIRVLSSRNEQKDAISLVELLLGSNGFLIRNGLYQSYLEVSSIAMELHSLDENKRSLSIDYGTRGLGLSLLGRNEEALQSLDHACDLALEGGFIDVYADHLGNISSILSGSGNIELAKLYNEESLAFAHQSNNDNCIVKCMTVIVKQKVKDNDPNVLEEIKKVLLRSTDSEDHHTRAELLAVRAEFFISRLLETKDIKFLSLCLHDLEQAYKIASDYSEHKLASSIATRLSKILNEAKKTKASQHYQTLAERHLHKLAGHNESENYMPSK